MLQIQRRKRCNAAGNLKRLLRSKVYNFFSNVKGGCTLWGTSMNPFPRHGLPLFPDRPRTGNKPPSAPSWDPLATLILFP